MAIVIDGRTDVVFTLVVAVVEEEGRWEMMVLVVMVGDGADGG